jgi:hypothetical protein
MELIKKLENLGYTVELEGDNISLTFNREGRPDQNTIKPLLQELKTRKPEALKYLQAKEQDKVIDFQAEAAKVKAALSRQGITAVKSDTLGEVIYWAKDETEAAKAPLGAVVYILSELQELSRGDPTRNNLKQIHAAKKIFGGRVFKNNENPFANT